MTIFERFEAEGDFVKMDGVEEYCEGLPVFIGPGEGRWDGEISGMPVIKAFNEDGQNSTEVDAEQLIKWLRDNRPELLREWLS